MKVLYDYQIFDYQKIGGISRYFYELMRNCIEFEIGVKYTDNLYLLEKSFFSITKNPFSFDSFLPGLNFKGKGTLYNICNNFKGIPKNVNMDFSINLLKKGDFDVFHPTYYDTYFLDYIGDKPFVLTIHDMIYEKFPEMFGISEKILAKKRLLAEKAARIIAISENTKKDIIDLYGVSEDKIDIIYHGSSLKCKEDVVPSDFIKPIIGKKYFLFTGARGKYKNFYFFIQSVQSLLKENKDIYIVCTANAFSPEEIAFFRELQIENSIIHIFVNDNDLYYLYKNALAFIFPSYYEGFGIPILEAFEAECPVILSNSSCFPEIAKNAALYFDPKNSSQLIQCCKSILQSSSLREQLINAGKKRLSDFNWKNTFQETLCVYQKVL